MTIARMELENVEAVIPAQVQDGGRVSGLSEFAGRRVLIVIPIDEERRLKKAVK